MRKLAARVAGLLAVPYIGCTYIELPDPSPTTSAGDLSDAGPAAGDATLDSMASDADAPPGDADLDRDGAVDGAAALNDAAVPVGTASDAAQDAASVDAHAPPTFRTVYAQIWSQCLDCHSPDGQQEPHMSAPELAYEHLVEDRSPQCEGMPFVVPGDPSKSFLYQLVSAARPACKSRMPPGGALTVAQLQVIADWIESGAAF